MTDTVAPSNMGKTIPFNKDTKTYDVNIAKDSGITVNDLGELELRISALESNQLKLKNGALYLGSEPSKYKTQYVDYINGSDSNDGTVNTPLKHLNVAISRVELGTVGSVIYIKENQDHYFDVNNMNYDITLNGSCSINPYGDYWTSMNKVWKDTSTTGNQTVEPLSASKEYQPYKPRLILRTINCYLPNDKTKKFNQGISLAQGVTLNAIGIVFKQAYDNDGYDGSWFSSVFKGYGKVITQGCEIENTADRHFFLTTGVSGSIEASLRYFIARGTKPIFAGSQFISTINVSYVVASESANKNSPTMTWAKTSTLTELKGMTHNQTSSNIVFNW
ncbi:hypothetical protein [Lonepinella sp. BR2357]|uniref:hypothetical protein n=1 Tax=Lonepinella sp. BR2357 TaxID=3434549 RepID=UPI003F6DEB94